MTESLKEGNKLSGDYRYDWLKAARDTVIDALGKKGKEFNDEHPHDAISLQDFVDVLNSCLLLIQAKEDES